MAVIRSGDVREPACADRRRARPTCRAAVAEPRWPRTIPRPGEPSTTLAAGIPFASIAWGDPADRPLVLIHGVTASSRIWWRVGPALAATGRRVVAVDLPGTA